MSLWLILYTEALSFTETAADPVGSSDEPVCPGDSLSLPPWAEMTGVQPCLLGFYVDSVESNLRPPHCCSKHLSLATSWPGNRHYFRAPHLPIQQFFFFNTRCAFRTFKTMSHSQKFPWDFWDKGKLHIILSVQKVYFSFQFPLHDILNQPKWLAPVSVSNMQLENSVGIPVY